MVESSCIESLLRKFPLRSATRGPLQAGLKKRVSSRGTFLQVTLYTRIFVTGHIHYGGHTPLSRYVRTRTSGGCWINYQPVAWGNSHIRLMKKQGRENPVSPLPYNQWPLWCSSHHGGGLCAAAYNSCAQSMALSRVACQVILTSLFSFSILSLVYGTEERPCELVW